MERADLELAAEFIGQRALLTLPCRHDWATLQAYALPCIVSNPVLPCNLVHHRATSHASLQPARYLAIVCATLQPYTLPCNRVRYLTGDGVVAITVEPAVLTAEQREMNADMDAEMDDLMGALPCYLATLALPCYLATLYAT